MKFKTSKLVAVVLSFAVILSLFAGFQATADEQFSKNSVDFFNQINVGMSIGNTLDSWPGGDETEWGNPKITKELLKAIKDKGFNAIRLPVTYYKTIGNAPKYLIKSTYLKRVKQVVDYAMELDLFVIINMHHEGDWLKPIQFEDDGVTPKTDEFNEMLAKYKACWTQIANAFKDYGEKLIFEAHNELRDGSNWSGYYEAWDSICDINDAFVSAVRSTGSNNEKRYLVLKGYAAGSSPQIVNGFRIPEDPSNHLAFSLHAYDPGTFCFGPSTNGGTGDTDKFTDAMAETLKNDLTRLMERVKKKFINNKIAVIVGEMGSVNKDNTADRVKHVKTYLSTCGEYGVKCFFWDNGIFEKSNAKEAFGLINRYTYKWMFEEVADALVETGNKYVNYPIEYPTTTQPTTEPTTAKPVLYGDANGDGAINMKDVLLMRKYIAGWNVTIDETAADVNNDNSINMKDVLMMRKYIAGIIKSFR